jgi:hypothetical protein
VPYTTVEARQQLLDSLASAADELAAALAALSEAYEQLDEPTAERVEEILFRPVQSAYGRAKRTYAEFAARHALPARAFAPAAASAPGNRTRELLERAVARVRAADQLLADLQDSMLPVEVGDTELRAGIAAVRSELEHVPAQERALVRTLGR